MGQIQVTNIKDMQLGQTQTILAMVKNIEQRRGSNQALYQRVTIRDRNNNETVCLLFENLMQGIKLPTVMMLTVNIGSWQNSLSYKILNYEVRQDADIQEFMPKARFDQIAAWNMLVAKVSKMRQPLRNITGFILQSNKKSYIDNPMNLGYRRRGGILEATLKLAEAAESLSNIYNLDHDLILAGAMLYNVGRVNTVDILGNTLPEDVLIGASSTAHEMIVRTKIEIAAKYRAKGKEDSAKMYESHDDIRMLEHLILSQIPGVRAAIPEAVALQHLEKITLELDDIEDATKEIMPGTLVTSNSFRYGTYYCRKNQQKVNQLGN